MSRTGTLAVIDIGSNSIRVLIVEPATDGGYRTLHDAKETVRLASGLTKRGRLTEAAIGRAVRALQRMAAMIRARGARRVTVVATSAIRNAANRRAFVDRVRRATGLRVRVISGAEEARLAFKSAALSANLEDRPCAVADVGGGSTELVLAVGDHIKDVHSLPLGAVALTEEHLHSDPIRRREFKALRRAIRKALRAAGVSADPAPQFLIASGGTASASAQMMMAGLNLSGRPVRGFEMTRADLLHLRESLLRRTLRERRRMPGLSPDRADIIVAGVAILYEILDHLDVNVLRVSARGIRHALVHRLMGTPARDATVSILRRRRMARAEAFGRSLRFEQAHGRQVQRLALQLFDQLAVPLGIDPGARDLIGCAALLHDVGYVVGFRGHHKHAYNLIAHAQIDGFSPREHEIMALIARYHRRSAPRRRHPAWRALAEGDRDLVARLAALVRIADALDRRHAQHVREVRCRVTPRRVRFDLAADGEAAIEIEAATDKGEMFRRLFGREIAFVAARASRRAAAAPAPRAAARRATA